MSTSPVNSIFSKKPTEENDNNPVADFAEISIKDFFDFMKTAYQVYEHIEKKEETVAETKIDWDELTKKTLINHILDQSDRDLLQNAAIVNKRPIISRSECALGGSDNALQSNLSASLNRLNDDPSLQSRCLLSLRLDGASEPAKNKEDPNYETSLKAAVQDVLNEGIFDSILPYMVGYKRITNTTSSYQPILKCSQTTTATSKEMKKHYSFGGFHADAQSSKDRLGRRKSSITHPEATNSKNDPEVDIHVCDEIKGVKKDFKCPQKLLVSKMGYFADVTVGQRLQDMDISVHCDIQIFDWLMRWVKKDSILVADWPMLDPTNVIPILVSASFLQMDPLIDDGLQYCHSHMSEIVQSSSNLACLSENLLTRLAAMYTNSEVEMIKDKKDKIHSRLYCKLIMSLAELVPETLRGHFASISNLFKCNKCNKLMVYEIAEKIPCQPVNMKFDRTGNVISNHSRDPSWCLNEYIMWLHSELRSWRRVYWRLWGDCHFLKCRVCDSHFPAYQMEWCCHHPETAQYFKMDSYKAPLPIGRYPCCGERAYRFQLLQKPLQGCQFRSHMPCGESYREVTVMDVYVRFRDIIAMPPPHLMFPERMAKLVARETQITKELRLQGVEKFWWDGIVLVPPRKPLGLLAKLYSSDSTFNPNIEHVKEENDAHKTGAKANAEPLLVKLQAKVCAEEIEGSDDSSSSSESGSDDGAESCPSRTTHRRAGTSIHKSVKRVPRSRFTNKQNPGLRNRVARHWSAGVSARGNQDAQRRFEERAIVLMRSQLITKKVAPKAAHGGIYAKLESEWRDAYMHAQQLRQRSFIGPSSRTMNKSFAKFGK